jgi:DNA-binding MarR family transcriptional regulator
MPVTAPKTPNAAPRSRPWNAFAISARPVVVEIVDALEARGLVERRRDPADRRLNALHVTGRGRDLLERATAELGAANEDLTRPIGEAGDRELRSLLRKLLGYA